MVWGLRRNSARLAALALLMRGLWWRRGVNAAVLAVAVVTTAASALGPLYARAAGESTLNDHLREATWRAGIHAQSPFDASYRGFYARLSRQVLQPGRVRGYDRTIRGITTGGEVGVSFPDGFTGNVRSQVVWRAGACRHLQLVRGRCPSSAGEALASERSAESGLKWGPGTSIVAYLNSGLTKVPLRIVGAYRPNDTADPFWFGHNYFNAEQRAGETPTVDSLFVAEPTFLTVQTTAFVQADFDYPLSPDQLRLADVASERATVRHLIVGTMGGANVIVRSGLFEVLDAAGHDRHLVDVGTVLVILQLALLAWLVFFQVAADAIEARGAEIAMAKLRGYSPWQTIRFGLAEPVLLSLLAVPLGVLLALGLTHAFAASVLTPGVPVVLSAAPVWAALGGFAGGLFAAALTGYRTLTRPVLEQWRRTTRRPAHGWVTLAADVALAGAAVGGLIALRAGHRPGTTDDTAALLAPGLLVFAVALLGVRVLPLACRRLARVTRSSRRIGMFLASRQVARRPVGLRLAAMLAVAAGLATFAAAGETVTTTNRDARAAAELGAQRVVSVQFGGGLDPVAAAHRADPHGTWAAAAATWIPDDGSLVAEPVLAVDSTRLAAVGKPVSGGLRPAALGALLTGAPLEAIHLHAARVRVHLLARHLSGDTHPQLQLNLRTLTEPFLNVEGPTIRDGAANYTAPVPCRAGCTLLGLTWDRPITAVDRIRGQITLTGIDAATGATWRSLKLSFGNTAAWRPAAPQGQAYDHLTVLPHGIRDEFSNRNGGYGGIIYGSAPALIPAVVTASTPLHGTRRGQVIGGIGSTARFRVVRQVKLLPDLLDFGVAMNAQYLEAELPEFRNEAAWQIWLGANAPANALARLKAVGLHIETVHSEQQRIALLARQGPALALLLLLVCAIAGAVLAAAGTAISISASSRRRSYEIAALQAVGVSRPALLRAGMLEQLFLHGAAILLGVPTGLLAARLAMPVIPEFSDRTPVVLHYTPQWLPALAFVAALVALLTLTAALGGAAPLRHAEPAQLREVEA